MPQIFTATFRSGETRDFAAEHLDVRDGSVLALDAGERVVAVFPKEGLSGVVATVDTRA